MNRALVDLVDRWCRDERPDVIFTYLSGELVWPETVQAMRSQGIPIVNLCLNDKEHFVGKVRGGRAFGMRDICRHFDLCWTSTEDALKKYCVEGAMPLYLPEGANPEVHRPYDVERSIDVAFVGQCYGNRPEVIRKLQEKGIRAEAFGFGWPNGALATDEMVKMYSRSRINLGFGGVAGHDDTYCLKGRDFEIPMSGGLYVTESCAELGKFFRPGRGSGHLRGFRRSRGEDPPPPLSPRRGREDPEGGIRAGPFRAHLGDAVREGLQAPRGAGRATVKSLSKMKCPK